MVMEHAERQNAERISGVANLTFDLVAVLHEKLKAIAVYEVYKRDAEEAGDRQATALFGQFQEADRTAVQQLRDMLGQTLRAGSTGTSTSRADALINEASQETFP
jgi:hypothetical protein